MKYLHIYKKCCYVYIKHNHIIFCIIDRYLFVNIQINYEFTIFVYIQNLHILMNI